MPPRPWPRPLGPTGQGLQRSRPSRRSRPSLEELEPRLVLSASAVNDTYRVIAGETLSVNASGAQVVSIGDGEVILPALISTEFQGAALPSDWTGTPWSANGTAAVSGGRLAVDGAQ